MALTAEQRAAKRETRCARVGALYVALEAESKKKAPQVAKVIKAARDERVPKADIWAAVDAAVHATQILPFTALDKVHDTLAS